VTSAGLVLAGTFIVFGLVAGSGAGGSQFRDIALGLAFGILMDTFLVRTLLVPSTVVLLGRWNWWPSRMSRRDAVITAPAEPDRPMVTDKPVVTDKPAAQPDRTP
jgi:RND superfamily putative drug exporter